MVKLTPQQVTEVNTIIADIEKSVQPSSEIGAREKASLSALLKANKIDKKPTFFKCKREYSDIIVSHFVKEKKVVRNKFHMNAQPFIYIL